VLTLHPISAGAGVKYLTDSVMRADAQAPDRGLSMQDYLSQHGDAPGEWLGRGAALLELSGEVTDAQAEAIFQLGADPRTGALLGRRFPTYPTADEVYERLLKAEPNASVERQARLRTEADKAGNNSAKSGWEMVISPVKSFSVAWGLADDAGRERLAEAEKRAAAAVGGRIEDELAWTRIGVGGAAQVKTEGLVAGWFLHRSSRAGDPTFHRHLVISTRVPYRDEKGRVRWLSLDATPLHAMTVALSEFYTTSLEREMAQLGFLAAPREQNIVSGKRPVREYVGVPRQALALFSSRRQGTERAYARLLAEFVEREHREPTRAESYRLYQAAALVGRPDKEMHSVAAEREVWRRRAAAEGGIEQPEQLAAAMRQASLRLAGQAARVGDWREQVIGLVQVELRAHHASWKRSNIEAEVIRQLTVTGAHLQQRRPLPELVGEIVAAVIGDVDTVTLTAPELVPAPAAYRRQDGESVFRQVNATQYTSARALVAERDVVAAAVTPAGLAVLSAAEVDAALAAGDPARGFSPSEQQRQAVRAVFGADRLVGAVIGRAGTGKTTIMQMVREVAAAQGIAVLGLATGQAQADVLEAESGIRSENIARWLHRSELSSPGHPDWMLQPGTLVIVDEAGQAGTGDLAALLAQVQEAGGGARMLLVGDHLQAGAVAAGGILAELETQAEASVVTLDEVRRFRDHTGKLREWETRASLALAAGDAASFDAYHARGRIHAGSPEAMAEAAYQAFLADTKLGLSSVLIAPDNATAAALSARVREARIVAGLVQVDGPSIGLADGNTAAVGDVVATRRNNRDLPVSGGRGYVRNGDTWTVLAVREDGGMQVRDRISGAVAELSAQYTAAWVQLGYALTGYRAQGLTVDTAHALIRPGMTRNAAYPSLTRGRYENHAYIELSDAVDLETGEPGYPTTARHVWSRVIERDGTDQSAEAQVRAAQRAAGALSGLYMRARYVLADLGTERMEHLARHVLGPAAPPVIDAAAWPTLAELLRVLEAEGQDPAAVLATAHAARDMLGAVDQAAVLHSRIVADPDQARLVAARTVADVEVAGPGLLHLLGILPPHESVPGEKAAFARELGTAIITRSAELTAAAETEAWTRALCGPAPEDVDQAAARAARVQAAALYRSLTDRTSEKDPLGPPPPAGAYGLRVLWRRAQPAPDLPDLRGRALNAVGERLDFARHLPPVPCEPGLYAAWAAAAAAVVEYRDRWGVETGESLLGEPVADRVQAADRRAAQQALARSGLPEALRHPAPAADYATDRQRAEIYYQRGVITEQSQLIEDIRNRRAAIRQAGRAEAAEMGGLIEDQTRAEALVRAAHKRIRFLAASLAVGADPWAERPYGHLFDKQLTARARILSNRAANIQQLREQIEDIRSGAAAERYADEQLALAAERVPTIRALQAAQQATDAAKTARDEADRGRKELVGREANLRQRAAAPDQSRKEAKALLALADKIRDHEIPAAWTKVNTTREDHAATLDPLHAAEQAEQRAAARTPGVDAEEWVRMLEHPEDVRSAAQSTFTGRMFMLISELGPLEAKAAREAGALAEMRAEQQLRAALPDERREQENAVRTGLADQDAKNQRQARRDGGRGPSRPGPAQQLTQEREQEIDRTPRYAPPSPGRRITPTYRPPGHQPGHGIGR